MPPNFQSALLAQMESIRDDAQTAENDAEAAAALARDISNIEVPDDLVAVLLEDPLSDTREKADLVVAHGRRTRNAMGHLAHSLDLSGPDRDINKTRSRVGSKRYRKSGGGTAEIVDNRLVIDPIAGAATILNVDDLRGMKWTRMAYTMTAGDTDGHNAVTGWSRNGFGSYGDPALGGPESGGGSIQNAGYVDHWLLFCVEVKEVGDPGHPGLIDPYTELHVHTYETPVPQDGETIVEHLIGYDEESSSMTIISLYDGSVVTVTDALINAYVGDDMGLQERQTNETDGHVQFVGWDHFVDDIAVSLPSAPPVAGACPVFDGEGYTEADIEWTPTGTLRGTVHVDGDALGDPDDEGLMNVWSRVTGNHAFDFRINGTKLQLRVSDDGVNEAFGVVSSANLPVAAGRIGLRFLFDPVAATLDFSTSLDDGASWQALGAQRTSAHGIVATLPFASVEPLKLGKLGTVIGFHGAILSAELVDDAVVIASPDWTGAFDGTDDQGNQWYYTDAVFTQADMEERLTTLEKVDQFATHLLYLPHDSSSTAWVTAT